MSIASSGGAAMMASHEWSGRATIHAQTKGQGSTGLKAHRNVAIRSPPSAACAEERQKCEKKSPRRHGGDITTFTPPIVISVTPITSHLLTSLTSPLSFPMNFQHRLLIV